LEKLGENELIFWKSLRKKLGGPGPFHVKQTMNNANPPPVAGRIPGIPFFPGRS